MMKKGFEVLGSQSESRPNNIEYDMEKIINNMIKKYDVNIWICQNCIDKYTNVSKFIKHFKHDIIWKKIWHEYINY